MSAFALILPAAGKSTRFQDPHYKKPFVPIHDRAVWLHALDRVSRRSEVVQKLVVVAAEDREMFDEKFGSLLAVLGVEVVVGGAERADSIERALARVRPDVDFVAIHDAARPCVGDREIDAVFAAAKQTGAAILAVPEPATLKRSRDGRTAVETVSREGLWQAQTPQVFSRALILEAYAARGGFPATDDAQLVERLGRAVTLVRGSNLNLKITSREDLRLATSLLRQRPSAPSLDALLAGPDDG